MTAHYYRGVIPDATTDSSSCIKTSAPRVLNTLVTLTHPYLLVTFRLKPFHLAALTRGDAKRSFPEVT